MASKKKKNKVTKATPPVEKGIDFAKLYAEVTSGLELKQELDKLLKEANTKVPWTNAEEKTQYFKELYSNGIISPKQTGKSHNHLSFLNQYGKTGKMGDFTGNDAKEYQALTWMKQQMLKLHPAVIRAEIYKVAPWHEVKFEVTLQEVSTGFKHKVSQSMTQEFLQKNNSFVDPLVFQKVLQDLKNHVNKVMTKGLPYPGKPGNMTIVPSEYMDENKAFLVPKDMHQGFQNYMNTIKDGDFKALGDYWLEKHKPPPKIVPVPPVEDKKYEHSPVVDYNAALQKIEDHAKHVSPKNIWGEIEKSVLSHIKQEHTAALAAAKLKYEQGFRGTTVQDSLKNVLPCLYEQVKCPDLSCGETKDMATMIIHLNDGHLWTREAIADWAEALDIDISVKETK